MCRVEGLVRSDLERAPPAAWLRPPRPPRFAKGTEVTVWLASRSQQYPSASEHYSYNRLRNRVVAAFRLSSFRSLRRDTAGGSCVGDPVLPRSLPYFIQLFFCCVFERFARNPSRRGDSSFSWRLSDGRIGA